MLDVTGVLVVDVTALTICTAGLMLRQLHAVLSAAAANPLNAAGGLGVSLGARGTTPPVGLGQVSMVWTPKVTVEVDTEVLRMGQSVRGLAGVSLKRQRTTSQWSSRYCKQVSRRSSMPLGKVYLIAVSTRAAAVITCVEVYVVLVVAGIARKELQNDVAALCCLKAFTSLVILEQNACGGAAAWATAMNAVP